jgi:isopentenyldiphosphate isomerase
MDEKITVSPITDIAKKLPYSRRQFYEEQFGGGRKDLAAHIIDVLLFDPSGDLILQKRSLSKNHNPGLIDKTLGGHITFGNSANYTVMVESVQELLTPSIVLDDETDFDKAFELLQPYIDIISILEKKAVRPWNFKRLHNGRKKMNYNVVHLYFGIYNGRIRPADREASGVLYYSIDQLESEIAATPNLFTDDLIQILGEYRADILAFQKRMKVMSGA